MRTLGAAIIILLCSALLAPATFALMAYVLPRDAASLPNIIVPEHLPKLNVPANCINGARQCADNTILQCRDKEWKVIEKCDANELCDSKRGCYYITRGMRNRGVQLATTIPANCPRWRPYQVAPPGCPKDLSTTYLRR